MFSSVFNNTNKNLRKQTLRQKWQQIDLGFIRVRVIDMQINLAHMQMARTPKNNKQLVYLLNSAVTCPLMHNYQFDFSIIDTWLGSKYSGY